MLCLRTLFCAAAILVLAARPSNAEEVAPKAPRSPASAIRRSLQESNERLLASNAHLAADLANVEMESDQLASDLANFNAEVEALDALLDQLESKRIKLRKRLADLYQTNVRLREKLVAKPD